MINTTSYTVNLSSYSIGADAYKQIPHAARFLGKKVAVIGGQTALSKAKDAIIEGVAGSDIEILDFIWYGGECTHENSHMLMDLPAVQEADILFAVGGGRAIDTVKYAAHLMDKPLFTFPTVGSNCAAFSAQAIMYYPGGSYRGNFPTKPCNHCFINSAIIADSPEPLFWAGIGDALSKEFEVVFASQDDQLFHTTLLGQQISCVCTAPILDNGKKALEDFRAHRNSFELIQVILDIIISTGLASNLTTTEDNAYYYNSMLAHCVYYGSTVTKKGHNHLHGEVVALGTLVQVAYAGDMEMVKRLMDFNYSIGLPICFDDVEIEEDEFETMYEKFKTSAGWKHKPKCVTKERFFEVMKEVNALGRAYKAQKAQA